MEWRLQPRSPAPHATTTGTPHGDECPLSSSVATAGDLGSTHMDGGE
jgi:hypothetical protein